MLEAGIWLIYCSLFLSIITVPMAIVEYKANKRAKARAKAVRRSRVNYTYNKAA